MADFFENALSSASNGAGKLLGLFGVQPDALIPITVVIWAWTVISVLILSVALILDMQENRSRLCFVSVCAAVSLSMLEIAVTVIFFPCALILPIVNALFIGYSAAVLIHIRGRKNFLCRIAAASVIIFEALGLLFAGSFIAGMYV